MNKSRGGILPLTNGVAIPARMAPFEGVIKRTLRAAIVGQSFLVEAKTPGHIRRHAVEVGAKITLRRLGPKMFRVWKI